MKAMNPEAPPTHNPVWISVRWCLPALLGFVLFLFSFPIDRHVPLTHLTLVDAYALWFVFIAPATTIIAIVTFMRRRRTARMTPWVKSLTWIVIAVSLLVNALMLFSFWADTF